MEDKNKAANEFVPYTLGTLALLLLNACVGGEENKLFRF